LNQVEEEEEAHLPVPSERRRMVYSDGAMEGKARWCSQRREEKEGGEDGGGGRRRREMVSWWLGFLEAEDKGASR
jgi:hypothetical protein